MTFLFCCRSARSISRNNSPEPQHNNISQDGNASISSGRLDGIRKRLSRESWLSRRSERGQLRTSRSGDIAIRPDKRMGKTPEGRPTDIFAASGYDSDAARIETPSIVSDTMSGTIQVNTGYLKRVVRKLEPTKEPQLHEESKNGDSSFRKISFQMEERTTVGSGDMVPSANPTKETEEPREIIPARNVEDDGAGSIPVVWEFGSKESPTDLMRRISAVISRRNELRSESGSPSQELRLSFAAPRRKSSVPRDQDAAHVTPVRSHLVVAKNSIAEYVPTQDLYQDQSSSDQQAFVTPKEESFEVPDGVQNTRTVVSKDRQSSVPQSAAHSEQSIHLYNLKISQRLASDTSLHPVPASRRESERSNGKDMSSLSTVVTNPYHVPYHFQRQSKASSIGLRPNTLSLPYQSSTSSVYRSQPGSQPSSDGSSVLHIPNAIDKWTKDSRRTSIDRRDFDHTRFSLLSEGEWMRRKTIDTVRSSMESIRTRELASAESRFPSLSHKISGAKESKFTENLDSFNEKFRRQRLIYRSPRANTRSRSFSDGWLSGGRRQGYGFEVVQRAPLPSPIITEEDDASRLWERALRFHAQQAASMHSGSMRGLSLSRHRKGRRSTRHVSPSVSSENFPMREDLNRGDDSGKEIWRNSMDQTVGPRIEKQIGNFSNRSYPTWSSFPSHSRKERMEHAGLNDNVIPRDFSPPQATIAPVGTSKDLSSSAKRKNRKKTKSMTFGRRNFFSKTYWRRLYRSHSSDMRRYNTGHRSSVSIGGKLEYPELEIIPGGELAFVMHEVRELKRDRTRRTGMSTDGLEIGDSGGQSGSWDADPCIRPSASMWSRLYEECVDVAKGMRGGDGASDTRENGGERNEEPAMADSRTAQPNDVTSPDDILDIGIRLNNDGLDLDSEMPRVSMDRRGTAEPAKTELKSEMSAFVKELLAEEERAREDVLMKAQMFEDGV